MLLNIKWFTSISQKCTSIKGNNKPINTKYLKMKIIVTILEDIIMLR